MVLTIYTNYVFLQKPFTSELKDLQSTTFPSLPTSVHGVIQTIIMGKTAADGSGQQLRPRLCIVLHYDYYVS